jgi:hypothetical protein
VWEHDGINPKDFEYIESCLKETWNIEVQYLSIWSMTMMSLQLKGLWEQNIAYSLVSSCGIWTWMN